MEDIKNNGASAIEKSHVRSVSYPSSSITESVDFVQKIYAALGNSSFNTRETIARVLNTSPNTIQMALSTAGQYGLLEMKSKVGYRPTQLFLTIYKPKSDKIKEDALIACLKNPKLYQALIQKFENDIVPSKVGLGIQLFHDHSVADNVSEKAASIFIENLQILKLLDGENVFRLNAFQQNESETTEVKETQLATQELPTVEASEESRKPSIIPNIEREINTNIDAPESVPIVIPFKSGRRAKLVVPENVTNDELDKIIKFIDALRE